jgi:hypothetical protein
MPAHNYLMEILFYSTATEQEFTAKFIAASILQFHCKNMQFLRDTKRRFQCLLQQPITSTVPLLTGL